MKKSIICIIILPLLIFGYIFLQYTTRPIVHYIEYIDTDRLKSPQQVDTTKEPFEMEVKGEEYRIYPLADYIVHALVVSRKRYHRDLFAKISPIDLALAWGGMMKEELQQYVNYSQANRWYYYTYSHHFPHQLTFITSQTSNNHIVPASKNIWNMLKKMKKGDTITLYGHLVNILHIESGLLWKSSLTRYDTGAGACEIIYVDAIHHRGRTYK